jgi:two-component system, OmpR family, response regulator
MESIMVMKNILLIDDDPDLWQLLELLLESDWQVRLNPTGHQALEMLGGASPDLVRLNNMMPDRAGTETIARL